MKPDITNRLEKIIDYYHNRNVNEFAKNIGISQQRINRLFNVDVRTKKYPSSVQDDILKAIILMYSKINERWLLTGEGSMLKDGSVINSQNEKGDNNISVNSGSISNSDVSGGKVKVATDSNISKLIDQQSKFLNQQTKLMEQLSESQKQVSKLIEQLSGKDKQINNLIEQQSRLIDKLK